MALRRIFVAALLAISHPVPATPPFGQVLARDGGSASYPEPLIFYNLTREEFTAKLLEHRNATKRATDDSVHLHKRDVYLEERRNEHPEQTLVEARQVICDLSFPGRTHRVAHGWCRSEQPQKLFVMCRLKTYPREGREKFGRCPTGQECDGSRRVVNFIGRRVHMPSCRQVLETVEEVSDGDDEDIPVFEGHSTIPDPNQTAFEPSNSPPWSPSALDHLSTFWEIPDERNLGFSGQWEYRARYQNGQEFNDRSFGETRTWSCIGCPAGVLYLAVYGLKVKALGSTYK